MPYAVLVVRVGLVADAVVGLRGGTGRRCAICGEGKGRLGFVVSMTDALCALFPRVVKKTPAFSPSQGAMSVW